MTTPLEDLEILREAYKGVSHFDLPDSIGEHREARRRLFQLLTALGDNPARLNPYAAGSDSDAVPMPSTERGKFIWGVRYYAGMLEDDGNLRHEVGHIQELCAKVLGESPRKHTGYRDENPWAAHSGELVTAEYRQLAARLHYAPHTWKHRQVLRWVETGEWNAGIGDSMPRVAAAIAGAVGEALKANRVEVAPVNVYLGGMLPTEAAEPAVPVAGEPAAETWIQDGIASALTEATPTMHVRVRNHPSGFIGGYPAIADDIEFLRTLTAPTGLKSVPPVLDKLSRLLDERDAAETNFARAARDRDSVLSQVETLQAGKLEAERVAAELKAELADLKARP